MISKPKLDCKDAVEVGCPEYKDGTNIIPSGDKTIRYSSGKGDTSSGPNLSAKFKYPSVNQSVGEYGANQYE